MWSGSRPHKSAAPDDLAQGCASHNPPGSSAACPYHERTHSTGIFAASASR